MARTTVEECGARLDVRALARERLLNGDDWTAPWPPAMRLVVRGDTVLVEWPREAQQASQTLLVTRTRCPYGSSRAWFLCAACRRRCAVVYRLGGRLACRRCQGLAYRTQHEHTDGRLLLKAERIWRRLGWDFGEEGPKPKGMHRRTLDRLANAADEAYAGSLYASSLVRRFMAMEE